MRLVQLEELQPAGTYLALVDNRANHAIVHLSRVQILVSDLCLLLQRNGLVNFHKELGKSNPALLVRQSMVQCIALGDKFPAAVGQSRGCILCAVCLR